MRYLARRAAHALVVLFGVTVLSFSFAEAAPGSHIDELALDPRVSAGTITVLRERYGLDRPLPQKYLFWLRSVARGDLGFSIAYDSPVGPLLWPRVRNTLLLSVPATALAWLIAIPIGAWTAYRKGRWVDRAAGAATTALLSLPELLVGLCLLLFAVRTGVVPTGGMTSPGFHELGVWAQLQDIARHFLLPVTALVLLTVPVLIRHVRAALIEVLSTPFIQAARAIGVPSRRIVFRHALRAAAHPLISLFGLSIAALLSASLVVEALMSWPGLGPLLLDAVAARDLHLVIGAVLCSTLLLMVGNLVADGLLYLIDPRVRVERA